jgi:hypothetical protein
MSDPHRDVTIRLRRTDGYKFEVAYADPAATRIQIDEPPPLGEGQGPNPSQVLASAVAGCLGASLLFCLGKRDAAVDSMHAGTPDGHGRARQPGEASEPRNFSGIGGGTSPAFASGGDPLRRRLQPLLPRQGRRHAPAT